MEGIVVLLGVIFLAVVVELIVVVEFLTVVMELVVVVEFLTVVVELLAVVVMMMLVMMIIFAAASPPDFFVLALPGGTILLNLMALFLLTLKAILNDGLFLTFRKLVNLLNTLVGNLLLALIIMRIMVMVISLRHRRSGDTELLVQPFAVITLPAVPLVFLALVLLPS